MRRLRLRTQAPRPRTAPLPCPSEHEEQVALMHWAAAMEGRHPELRLLAAVPNGGLRNVVVARKLRAEGVRAGYPDLILDVGRGGYHGLRVEMKRLHGGQVTAEQKWWHERLEARGYMVRVCRGLEAARDAILAYLAMPATARLTAAAEPTEKSA